jgi:hypothetical protein
MKWGVGRDQYPAFSIQWLQSAISRVTNLKVVGAAANGNTGRLKVNGHQLTFHLTAAPDAKRSSCEGPQPGLWSLAEWFLLCILKPGLEPSKKRHQKTAKSERIRQKK